MKQKTNAMLAKKKSATSKKILASYVSDTHTLNKKKTIDSRIDFIYSKKSAFWTKYQEEKIVLLFKDTARNVSGYKNFLKEIKVNVAKVATYTDLDTLPPVTKANYLRKHSWETLCKKNVLINDALVLTSTSGSTGTPFYFPRNNELDMHSALYHQMFVRCSKLKVTKSTLVIDCFAMGVWIGGLLTYQAFKHITESGYPMTIITPGVNKKEIYDALKHLGPQYEQIILCGYPPFMKDVVDEAHLHGIVWSRFDVRMVFAAEGFSEAFRDYMMKKTGMKNPYRDTMNIYGSADVGTMAEETPICVLVRRLAMKHIGLYTKIFGQATRLPTLTQYIPTAINFEPIDGKVYVSSDTVLPLVRYEIGDNGGVFSYQELVKMCESEGIDIKNECKKVGIEDTVAELPFVYVYERTDFSTKLYGAIIYPEYIKHGLQSEKLENSITGKFTMYTKYNETQDEYLEVNVELLPGVNETKALYEDVMHSISKSLIEKSAEHKNNVSMMPKGKVDPVIVFWPHEHEIHFKNSGKHKWVKKDSF